MNYFISDLHFFCNSQIDNGGVNYDGRPFKTLEEMHEKMLTRWNEKITNGDTVYILGDIGMRGRNDALIALVAQLKGKKILIKGNHDDLSDYRYKQLFAEIYDYKELSESFAGNSYKLVLSHYPILMWNGQHKGSILLYGHTHVTAEDVYFQKCAKEMVNQVFENRDNSKEVLAINVGCMLPYMNYEPRSLKELLERQK
jgi:calcineurin-like phosphoesterase family protein